MANREMKKTHGVGETGVVLSCKAGITPGSSQKGDKAVKCKLDNQLYR
jgi:hypothetical protein